jgi:hypothetical protein
MYVLHGHASMAFPLERKSLNLFISFLFLWTGLHVLYGHVPLWSFFSGDKRIGAGVHVGWGHAHLPLRRARGSVNDAWAAAGIRL